MTAAATDEESKLGLAVIWAIGVGAAIGGDFFGWQFVLEGGFYGALLAVLYAAIFFWLYAAALSELAARYRTSGGAYDFVNAAMGSSSASIMAVLVLLKLILANCATCLAISSYLVEEGMPKSLQVACWILTYSVFTFLDCIGVKSSSRIQLCATFLCVTILTFYCISCLTKFHSETATSEGRFRHGIGGFVKGLPFSLQFYDGFEELPLLMGYAIKPEKTIPAALVVTFITVTSLAVGITLAGAGASSVTTLLNSSAPLMEGIKVVYGNGSFVSNCIDTFIVVGLLVNFFSFVIFTSQQVQAIAEGGQLPSILASRHPGHGAPIHASIFASIVGLGITIAFATGFGINYAQDILVTACLMPAALQYLLVLECVPRSMAYDRLKHPPNDPIARRIMGEDPGVLRFKYGIWGIRVSQLMCGIFVFSLIYLAALSKRFLQGLLILALLALLLYGIILAHTPEMREGCCINFWPSLSHRSSHHHSGNKHSALQILSKDGYSILKTIEHLAEKSDEGEGEGDVDADEDSKYVLENDEDEDESSSIGGEGFNMNILKETLASNPFHSLTHPHSHSSSSSKSQVIV